MLGGICSSTVRRSRAVLDSCLQRQNQRWRRQRRLSRARRRWQGLKFADMLWMRRWSAFALLPLAPCLQSFDEYPCPRIQQEVMKRRVKMKGLGVLPPCHPRPNR